MSFTDIAGKGCEGGGIEHGDDFRVDEVAAECEPREGRPHRPGEEGVDWSAVALGPSLSPSPYLHFLLSLPFLYINFLIFYILLPSP
jgi:hypothetical protein